MVEPSSSDVESHAENDVTASTVSMAPLKLFLSSDEEKNECDDDDDDDNDDNDDSVGKPRVGYASIDASDVPSATT